MALQALVQGSGSTGGSQTLVNLMNQWAALDPTGANIVWGLPGDGTRTLPNKTTKDGQVATISLDPGSYLNSGDTLGSAQAVADANYLADALAHELSHALLQLGMVVPAYYPPANNPLQASIEELNAEQVAYNNEYQVLQELGLPAVIYENQPRGPSNTQGPGVFNPTGDVRAYGRAWAAAVAPSTAPNLNYGENNESFGCSLTSASMCASTEYRP
jgi:hypothetical protein